MKNQIRKTTLIPLLTLTAAVLLNGGCASSRSLVLAPVGPPPASPLDTRGSLVVFSAFDLHPQPSSFDVFPYSYRADYSMYSDYKIFSEDGGLLQRVKNENPLEGGPVPIKLPSGKYRIVAEAYGYGIVTVPVVIENEKTTVVHLDGSPWPDRGELVASNPVRLPNGKIVGWRAEAPRQ